MAACSGFALALTTLVAIAPAEDASNEWKPANGPLRTRWAAEVRPDSVHNAYPRPQMVRPNWTNLNGLWEYAIRPRVEDPPAKFDGKILVPFPVESALSGVMKPVKPDQRLWYRRSFALTETREPGRWLLHFGAVDWDATVTVNGKSVGQHRGGYDPFTVDITDAVKDQASQEVIVSVWDPTDTASQPRGKQVLRPGGIMYTANTGIWQTVWLERVPEAYIASLKIVPDVNHSQVSVTVKPGAGQTDATVSVRVLDGNREIAETQGKANSTLTIEFPNPKLWSPDSPFLYGLQVRLGNDSVESYFGMRSIAIGKDDRGINRLLLNGKALFHLGPLDQGWWPDGLYTAPNDDALKFDIEATRRMGFNMIRKHVKVEPDRWYYWCDRMGVLVWQDMPSGDNRDDDSRSQFKVELERMIDALRNHPSIVMWVPFNEGWGQHDTPWYVDWIRTHDPSRLVNNASGWTDTGTGDVFDMHAYPGPGMPPLESGRVSVLGEFGGLGLPLKDHLWVDKDNWGYRTYKSASELQSAYEGLIHHLGALISMGLGAAVYTQTTDCEVEVNGLLTYDRAVTKIPVEVLAGLHARLLQSPAAMKVLSPTAINGPQTWRYTTHAPAPDWIKPDFDDSMWPTGDSGFGTREAAGSIVRTEWRSPDIWLRRTFELDDMPQSPQLVIHHDDAAEIFINGKPVFKSGEYGTGYRMVSLSGDGASAFKKGRNVLAVRCHQEKGAQYIDVGVVELLGSAGKERADANIQKRDFTIGKPPETLGLKPFYEKHISVDGLPIVASAKVSDYALKEAAYLVGQMLSHRPEIGAAMARNKVRCAIMAYNERTTDIPEHSDLTPKAYWDVRARGLGATPFRPAISGAEENLLNYPGDPYSTENILIHEFGHAMHEMGLSTVDPTFDKRLRQAFEHAREKELWKGTYAATNPAEYWAEGVQSWFDTNRENDSQHNHVNTRKEIKVHDPQLAALLTEVFGDGAWRYVRPDQRPQQAHLAGYDHSKAPRFAWEPALLEANRKLRGDREKKRDAAGSSASPSEK